MVNSLLEKPKLKLNTYWVESDNIHEKKEELRMAEERGLKFVEVVKLSELKEEIEKFDKVIKKVAEDLIKYRVQRVEDLIGVEDGFHIDIRDVHRSLEDDYDDFKNNLGIK